MCNFLVFHTNISICAKNVDGKLALQLAKDKLVQEFLIKVSSAPLAPTHLELIGCGIDVIGMKWKDVNSYRTVCPEWYEIQYKRPFFGKWEKVNTMIDKRAESHWIGGLRANTEYTFRIRCWSQNGWSPFSKNSITWKTWKCNCIFLLLFYLFFFFFNSK